MKTTVYRVDDFGQFGVGDLLGFFTSLPEAEHVLSCAGRNDRVDHSPEKEFGQITEFEVDSVVLEDVDFKDREAMLSDEVWGSGEIINDYYYR